MGKIIRLLLVLLLVASALADAPIRVGSLRESTSVTLTGGGNRWVLTFAEGGKKPVEVVWDYAQARKFAAAYREAQQKGAQLDVGASTIIRNLKNPRVHVTVAVGRMDEGACITLYAQSADSSPAITVWVAQFNDLKTQFERLLARLAVPPGRGQPFRVAGSTGHSSVELSGSRNRWVLTFQTDDEKQTVKAIWDDARVRKFVERYREAQMQAAQLKEGYSSGAGYFDDDRTSVGLAVNRTPKGAAVTLHVQPVDRSTSVLFSITQYDDVRVQFEKLLERMR